jgi:hypothetical protein
MRAKLLAIKTELRRTMHDPIAKTGAWVKQMLKGHLNYFAVPIRRRSLQKGPRLALKSIFQGAQRRSLLTSIGYLHAHTDKERWQRLKNATLFQFVSSERLPGGDLRDRGQCPFWIPT